MPAAKTPTAAATGTRCRHAARQPAGAAASFGLDRSGAPCPRFSFARLFVTASPRAEIAILRGSINRSRSGRRGFAEFGAPRPRQCATTTHVHPVCCQTPLASMRWMSHDKAIRVCSWHPVSADTMDPNPPDAVRPATDGLPCSLDVLIDFEGRSPARAAAIERPVVPNDATCNTIPALSARCGGTGSKVACVRVEKRLRFRAAQHCRPNSRCE